MENQFVNNGEIAIIDSTTIEISELPVKTWTQVSHYYFILLMDVFLNVSSLLI